MPGLNLSQLVPIGVDLVHPQHPPHSLLLFLGEPHAKMTWFCLVSLLGPPVVPFCPFLGEGSPTKIDYRKKGTLILTSVLEGFQSNPKEVCSYSFHLLKNILYFPQLVLKGIDFTTGHILSFFAGGGNTNGGQQKKHGRPQTRLGFYPGCCRVAAARSGAAEGRGDVCGVHLLYVGVCVFLPQN